MASDNDETNRRDFLLVAAGAFGAVGGAAALWTVVDQMNPSASTRALSSTEVDVSKIEEGQAITVIWRKLPVFIRHRTQAEIQEARSIKKADLGELKDTKSRNDALPNGATDTALDANRTLPGKEKWLVVVGVCTHFGCVPKGNRLNDKKGDYKGWFCPCHGSHYDTSGRIRTGPAPENLPVPPYQFVTDTLIKIG